MTMHAQYSTISVQHPFYIAKTFSIYSNLSSLPICCTCLRCDVSVYYCVIKLHSKILKILRWLYNSLLFFFCVYVWSTLTWNISNWDIGFFFLLVLTFHLLWTYFMLQDVIRTHTAQIVYIVVTVVVVYSVITWPEPVQTDVRRVYTEINVTVVMKRLSFHSTKGSVPLTWNYTVFERTASFEWNNWRYFYKNIVIALYYFILPILTCIQW